MRKDQVKAHRVQVRETLVTHNKNKYAAGFHWCHFFFSFHLGGDFGQAFLLK